jgi:hypothetical protein
LNEQTHQQSACKSQHSDSEELFSPGVWGIGKHLRENIPDGDGTALLGASPMLQRVVTQDQPTL